MTINPWIVTVYQVYQTAHDPRELSVFFYKADFCTLFSTLSVELLRILESEVPTLQVIAIILNSFDEVVSQGNHNNSKRNLYD